MTFTHPPETDFHAELGGEYQIPVEFATPPAICDVGACCGAFAVWASKRWPGCRLHCYEPIPDNAKFLRQNVYNLKLNARVYECAVRSTEDGGVMYLGRNNCGEASFHDPGEQRTDRRLFVPTISASSLPLCDVLKIDTEGCELEILESIAQRPAVVTFEHGHVEGGRAAYEKRVAKGIAEEWAKLKRARTRAQKARQLLDDLGGAPVWKDCKQDWQDDDDY